MKREILEQFQDQYVCLDDDGVILDGWFSAEDLSRVLDILKERTALRDMTEDD